VNPINQVRAYLQSVERRLRLWAFSRGIAVTAAIALVVTIILAAAGNWLRFAEPALTPLRFVLFLAIAAALAFGIFIPLFLLNRKRAAREIEKRFPHLQQRLLTLTEQRSEENPFAGLVAEQTLEALPRDGAESFGRIGVIAALGASAVLSAVVLLWLILAAPGYLGYGASVLWAGTPREMDALYAIHVQPGNESIRRKSEEWIRARLKGFSSDQVSLYVRYQGASKWEQARMQPQANGPGYEFLIASVGDTLDYYVAAGKVRSHEYKLRVIDLPGVKRIRVQYHYPSWLGLHDSLEDPGGDLRAVQGTEAQVSIETDHKLAAAALILNDNSKLKLQPTEGNWLSTTVPLQKDGSYHVAAILNGQPVRISEDYFIEARKDEPPSVKVVHPGRDPRVSSIEELAIRVRGEDDFGLKNMDLHYSVNGGPEKSVSLLKSTGTKESEGKSVLALEKDNLTPGDVISFYASASDARQTSKSDIFFAEVQPFERNYTQSQQMGGGGGEGDTQEQISQRQKEIIAATWNEMRNSAKSPADIAEEARFLAETQRKLGEQAKTLAERMRSRDLAGNSSFAEYMKNMNEASSEMSSAVGQLKGQRWREALPPEQKALQGLLRAEAQFRDIQIAFGNQNGGLGGGAGRDLASMLDLELDTSKNQYETGQQAASPGKKAQQLQQTIDRLKALAERQQELAAQRQKEEAFRQRWEQEMLRREAEQLQRQIQQMMQDQSSSGQDSQQASSSSGGASSSGGQAARSSRLDQMARQRERASNRETAQAMAQTLDQLRKAEEAMRQAQRDPSAGGQQRAADQLNQASTQLGNSARQQAGEQVAQMTRQAGELAQQQREFANRLRKQIGARSLANSGALAPQELPYQRRRPWWFGGDASEQPAPKPTAEEQRLAREKTEMAQALKDLESRMQSSAQELSDSKPGAARQLREALSDAQGDELEMRMRKHAEWIEKGRAAAVWMSENVVTNGLDRLHQQLQSTQQAMSGSGQDAKQGGTQGAGQEADQLRRELGQLQRLRAALQAQSGGGAAGGRRADPWSGGGGNTAMTAQELARLGQSLGRNSDLRQSADDLLESIGPLNLRQDPAELSGRIDREILPNIARLELQMKQKLGISDTAHGSESQAVPEAYRDSVAEYFRRLSKAK
jgi:hypothetical protein